MTRAGAQDPDLPVRMLLVDTNDAMGGVVRVHLDLLRALDPARVERHVAFLDHGGLRHAFEALDGVSHLRISTGTKSAAQCGRWRGRLNDALSVGALLTSAWRLARHCRRHHIEVLHFSDKKRALLLALLLRRLGGPPWIYHIHNVFVDHVGNRRALASAALVVANSAAMKRDFLERVGPAMERIVVVHNGIPLADYAPDRASTLRRELGVPDAAVLAGIAGRLAPDKGQETFVAAMIEACRACPDLHGVLVGDDAIYSDNVGYVERLKAQIAAAGLSGRILFAGFRSDMPNVYAGLDVAVNAAWREAFGMVVVEPMACGRAVVGTRAGGIPEIITDGEDGLLYEPRNAAGLAAALLRLAADPGLRRRLGQRARRTVEERFSIGRQARRMEELYRAVARPAAGGTP